MPVKLNSSGGGSVTLDVPATGTTTTLTLPTTGGGLAASGANSDITSLSGLTTPLSVAQGGTGAASLTANNVLLGNGTSAVTTVAPGANGNVLTSNGTTWASAAPAVGGGLTLIATVNPTNGLSSTTITVSPFKVLTFVISGVSLSVSTNVRFQLSSDFGSTFGSNVQASENGTNVAAINDVYRTNEASVSKFIFQSYGGTSGTLIYSSVQGIINAVRFTPATGTFAGAGSILVYGTN